MGLFSSLLSLAGTPIRCAGELGKDLSSIVDDKKDGLDGILSLATLGASSLAKGVIKSLDKAEKELDK